MDECRHLFTELRRRRYSNGTVHFAVQCISCGNERQKVSRASLSDDQINNAPEWDDSIQSRYWEQRREAIKARSESAREEWDRKQQERYQRYLDYLQTPEWSERRRIRLALDDHLCQARLRGCTRRATQVHHLTYEFLFNEPMFSLVSVCRTCHEQISEMEGRTKREARVTTTRQTA